MTNNLQARRSAFACRWGRGGGHNIKRGPQVVQHAFGSGFKTNSAVWLHIK